MARATTKSRNDSETTVDNVETENVENTETQVPETETPVNRIPDALNVPILKDFCERYLTVLDEIAKYNQSVVAAKDSEWTAPKILEKAREFAKPADKDAEPDEKIAAAIKEWEELVTAVNNARKNITNLTAEKLGIQVSAVAERNTELEGPLKDKRKVAVEIGNQLSTMAKLTTDENASNAVNAFLASNPLPAVGRDQTRSFSGDSGTATPKYRVEIEVSRNGNVLFTEKGFTKTALALTKGNLYERGKALKPEAFRKAWEAAGNTSENTTQPVVEFEDNGLHYKITKS